MERETQIVYSPSVTYDARKTDPDLTRLRTYWESLLGPVSITEVEGRMVITPCQQKEKSQ